MPWNKERIAKLCLASCPFLGSRSLRKLWVGFDSAERAWLASRQKLIETGVKEKTVDRFLEWRREFEPDALLKLLDEQRIHVLFADDAGFPLPLRDSSDPPEILFVRGELKDGPAIAVVGTRHLTSYGARCVETIVPDLARAGLMIVSGLALGIDGLAHRATLDAKGCTVAILGTGVDDDALYPREHFSLAQRIIAEGGAVISEFPPGTGSRKEHFPIRNRLIAALAQVTIVVEAATKSGSLITAKLALEENREVMAVPGPIWNEQSKGTNALLKMGAKPCTCARDVFEVLALDHPELIVAARAELPVDPNDLRLLESLKEPRHVDEIGRDLEADAATVAAQLAILELKGLVKSIGGQMWVKT